MTDRNSIPDSEDSTLSKSLLGRRRVLGFGLGVAALAVAGPLKGALAALPQSGTRTWASSAPTPTKRSWPPIGAMASTTRAR